MNNPNQPYYPPQQPYQRPPKDRSLALVLEILPGLFGFLGFGWIYAGNTSAGIGWLIGYLVWTIFAAVLDAVTAGIFLCVHVPVTILFLVLSPVNLNKYMKTRPDIFGM